MNSSLALLRIHLTGITAGVSAAREEPKAMSESVAPHVRWLNQELIPLLPTPPGGRGGTRRHAAL